jgi:hypothetical protein
MKLLAGPHKGEELLLAGAKLSQEAGKPIKLRYKQPTNRKKAKNRPYPDRKLWAELE